MDKITDVLKMSGELTVEVHDEHGRLKSRIHIPNLIVTAGKTVMADRLALAVPTKAQMSHMGIGTNATAPSAGDTTLNTAIARVSLASVTPAANVITYVGTFPAGTGTGTIVEAGLFNANVAGDMLCRTTFGAQVKGATDSLTITWTVTIN
jgi:hypothetical protein